MMEPFIVFLFVLSFIINFLAFTFVLPAVIETYKRYSRGKLVVCPEKKQEATIVFSPNIAAATAIFLPNEIRVVKACSLWDEGLQCTRGCVAQVH
jgi:hypothetical protein